jgi:ABC-type transport system involved in multi-copper enzyme maturation permease subunit
MIWLTWRQHRREALVFAALLAAFAIYLIVLGRAMYYDYYHLTNGTSVASCFQRQDYNELCGNIYNAFIGKYSVITQPALIWFLILPLLLGMFIGAPLVARELETGTFRLIWTQSVTRLRWLLTKVSLLVVALALAFAAFIPLLFWWKGPVVIGGESDMIGGQYYPVMGILPLAYTLFALALGLAAGALLRRVVPAILVTLGVYSGVALAIWNWGRQNWLPPRSVTWNPYVSNGPTNFKNSDWILFQGYVNQAGQRVSFGDAAAACATPGGNITLDVGSPFNACVQSHGWLSTIVWQPADRFWAFQGIESGVLVALALALVALTIWLVRRRIA